jgi:hypothetical protein
MQERIGKGGWLKILKNLKRKQESLKGANVPDVGVEYDLSSWIIRGCNFLRISSTA